MITELTDFLSRHLFTPLWRWAFIRRCRECGKRPIIKVFTDAAEIRCKKVDCCVLMYDSEEECVSEWNEEMRQPCKQ